MENQEQTKNRGFVSTFLHGLLYAILFPFFLVFLLLYGIYLFFKNIFYIFLIGNKKYKEKFQKYDNKAENVLAINKYANSEENEVKPQEEIEPIKEENKVVYNTTNNIYFSSKRDYDEFQKNIEQDPNYINKLTSQQNEIEHHEAKEIEASVEEPNKVEVSEDGHIDLSYVKREE